MHKHDGLSALQIAARLDVSHSAVLSALNRLGIRSMGHGHVFKGRIPFGWDRRDIRLVKNTGEQQAIRLMRQLQGRRRISERHRP
jgi:hypothetical protein